MFDFLKKPKDETREDVENIIMYLIGLMDADFHRDADEIQFIKAQAAEWEVSEKRLRTLFEKAQVSDYKPKTLNMGKSKRQLIESLLNLSWADGEESIEEQKFIVEAARVNQIPKKVLLEVYDEIFKNAEVRFGDEFEMFEKYLNRSKREFMRLLEETKYLY